MTTKDVLSRLDALKRAKALQLYNNRLMPANNGGHYLSPSQWRLECNAVLSEVLGETSELKANVLCSVFNKLERG